MQLLRTLACKEYKKPLHEHLFIVLFLFFVQTYENTEELKLF